jgi:aspartyl protease family protein
MIKAGAVAVLSHFRDAPPRRRSSFALILPKALAGHDGPRGNGTSSSRRAGHVALSVLPRIYAMFGTHVQWSIVAVASAFLMAQALSHLPASGPRNKPGSGSASAGHRADAPRGYGEYRIAADQLGQYSTDVDINGARVHVIVDTGATYVALSHEDAARIGAVPAPGDYKHSVSTANGAAHVAKVMLNDVRLGSLLINNVEAFVGERGALSTSLLGMSFLRRLSKIEVASGALMLKQ